MELTQGQIEEFNEQGYLFMPNCFTLDEAKLLKGEANLVYALNRKEVWRENSGVARTAFAAHWYNERETVLIGVAGQEVPFGAAQILGEYRTYTFGLVE